MFQAKLPDQLIPLGHHQFIMLVAMQREVSLVRDVSGSIGNLILNCTFILLPPTDNCSLCPAYVQAIGCLVNSLNITATISPQSFLLDPIIDLPLHFEGPK